MIKPKLIEYRGARYAQNKLTDSWLVFDAGSIRPWVAKSARECRQIIDEQWDTAQRIAGALYVAYGCFVFFAPPTKYEPHS